MAHYLVGDVQGCDKALGRLLDKVGFSPSRDTVYLLGDLVNRGPASLAVLRRLMALGSSAQCLLGNHDLHLLATAAGVRKPHRNDTLDEILQTPERDALIDWLRGRPTALFEHGWLMVHAGVLPQWDREQTLSLAHELEAVLRAPDWVRFLQHMYGNTPDRWTDALEGSERLRVVVNALTRLRFCSVDGAMEFETKESVSGAPPGYLPWFDVPGRRTADVPLAFGHWSTLGNIQRERLLALDTGCVWGGCLTAARLGAQGTVAERVSVACEQARKPGESF